MRETVRPGSRDMAGEMENPYNAMFILHEFLMPSFDWEADHSRGLKSLIGYLKRFVESGITEAGPYLKGLERNGLKFLKTPEAAGIKMFDVASANFAEGNPKIKEIYDELVEKYERITEKILEDKL